MLPHNITLIISITITSTITVTSTILLKCHHCCEVSLPNISSSSRARLTSKSHFRRCHEHQLQDDEFWPGAEHPRVRYHHCDISILLNIIISTPTPPGAVKALLPAAYTVKERGKVTVKGKGEMVTFWVEGKANRTPPMEDEIKAMVAAMAAKKKEDATGVVAEPAAAAAE